MQIEQQKLEEQHEFELQAEEKQHIAEYAESLYMLNLCKKAFDGLKINMAPRKNYIRKLIEKYRSEQLKMKAMESFKLYLKRKHHLDTCYEAVQLVRVQHNFGAWISLYNERVYAKALKAPFMNIQKCILADPCDSNHLIKKNIYQGMSNFMILSLFMAYNV